MLYERFYRQPAIDSQQSTVDKSLHRFFRLLPSVDRPGSAGRLGSSSLSNEFFARACLEWRNALHEGEFTPENQQKMKTEAERDKSRLDPWKLKHFEPVWGEKRSRSGRAADVAPPAVPPEPAVAPPVAPAPAPARRRVAGAVTRSSARAAGDESKECKNKRGRPKSHYVDSAAFARSAWPADDEVPPADPLRADSDSERSAKRRALREDEPRVGPETEPPVEARPLDVRVELESEPPLESEARLEPPIEPLRLREEIAEAPEPQLREEEPPTPRPPTPIPPPTEAPTETEALAPTPVEFDEPEDGSESPSRRFVDAEPFAVESETDSKGEPPERPSDLFDRSPSDKFDRDASDSPETRSSDDEATRPRPEESVEPVPREDPPPPGAASRSSAVESLLRRRLNEFSFLDVQENGQSSDGRSFVSDAPPPLDPEPTTTLPPTDVQVRNSADPFRRIDRRADDNFLLVRLRFAKRRPSLRRSPLRQSTSRRPPCAPTSPLCVPPERLFDRS